MPVVSKQKPNAPARKAAAPTPTSPPGSDGDLAWGATEHVRALVYGRSGTGKTTFASTFPDPVLWLVCSGGLRPGELKSIDTPANRKRIRPEIVGSTAAAYELVGRAADYATVVLDHASGYQDLTVKELLGLDEVPVAKFRRAGKGESWSLVSQQQWGQSSVMCKEFFRALLSAPANVVVIAQEKVFGDAEGSEVITPTVGAALTPSVTGWLAPACDYVVQTYLRPREVVRPVLLNGEHQVDKETGQFRYTRKRARDARGRKEIEYCLRTAPHEVYQTKFRVPRGVELPECIVDPDYQKLTALIRGEAPAA